MANPLGWAREALLAIGLISLLVVGLWAATGSLPPMVVVESSSMMHDSEGEVGAIDPGDLVLVMATDLMCTPLWLGVITKQLPALEVGLEVFEVMTSDGEIMTYSTAALRVINRTRDI